ncbi:YncE family protein, partial [candidate division WOR-3 bacterium]|nr:YncE family protein [candidate division WOR-3 bacterium]
MRTWVMALGLCIVVPSVAPGQWLEKTIGLPDSLSGLAGPAGMLYNPGSNTLFIAGDNGFLVLDGLSHRKVALTLMGDYFSPGRACYASQVNKVYWADDGSDAVDVLDGASGRLLSRIGMAEPSRICYNPIVNRVYAACGYYSGYVCVINCASDSIRAQLLVGPWAGPALCCSPQENKVYCPAPSGSRAVNVIDCSRDSVRRRVAVGLEPSGLVYSRVSNRVYCWQYDNETLAVVDCRADSVVGRVVVEGGIATVAFNPVSNKLYCVGGNPCSLAVVCGAGDSLLRRIGLPGYVYEVASAFDSTDNLLWLAMSGLDSLVAVDGIGDTLCRAIDVRHEPQGLCYNPARNRLYSTGGDVAVTDPAAGAVVQRILVDFTPGALCWARWQNKVYCAGSNEASLAVISTTYNRVERFVAVGHRPSAL